MLIRGSTRFPSSSSEDLNQSVQIQKSSKSKGTFSQQGNPNPDPVYFREVHMSDLPSQYTGDIETFRQVVNLPDPRVSMPRSSTTVWTLNEVAGQQELKPRIPSALPHLSTILKEAFDKFEQDFQAANLQESKYINALLPLQSIVN